MIARSERLTTVQIVRDAPSFAALRGEWSALLEESAGKSLFQTWEWAHTWWSCLAERRRLLVLAVRSGAQLIAIAPFALRPAALFSVPPLPCIELLGSGAVGSDHLDLIVRRGWERETALALAEALGAAGETVALARLRSGSIAAQAMRPCLAVRGWRVRQTSGESCPFASRPPGGFREYLAGLGAEHRYAFRRKLRSLRKRFEVRFQLASTEEERQTFLPILIELHEQRWSGRGKSEAFSSPGLRAFHEELSRLALARGWLRLFVLRLDGAPAAALYGFRYGGVFSFYQSGFASRWRKESLGVVAMGLAIESAFDEGAGELDLLHGEERYKLHWARQTRRLERLELYPPGARGFLFEQVAALAKSARAIAKQLLRPEPQRWGPA